jgi:hypothetical protein
MGAEAHNGCRSWSLLPTGVGTEASTSTWSRDSPAATDTRPLLRELDATTTGGAAPSFAGADRLFLFPFFLGLEAWELTAAGVEEEELGFLRISVILVAVVLFSNSSYKFN